VLLALMDLCLEKTSRKGVAPDSVTTYQLAKKVTELYWPQTAEFRGRTLKQNSGNQARIVADIVKFRDSLTDPSVSLDRARREAPKRFERLVRSVEWTLILMPLPRLQVMGRHTERLIYEIGWDTDVGRDQTKIRKCLATGSSGFDNQVRLYPSVGDHLVLLNGLLRPLIHRAWSSMVAQLNGLDDIRLERFLFGAGRTEMAAARPGLIELQKGQCFYCGARLHREAEVDHFIPWARYPDNGIENLVAADRACNGAKRDFLAATGHVKMWRRRNESDAIALTALARGAELESHPEETIGVARGIYLRLPVEARLWVAGSDFAPTDPAELKDVLA
jgi:5-methylcytosine-specific restriction endonuclease McrA